MPLYAPSSGSGKVPNVIVGECNTPPSGTPEELLYDTWYDEAQDDITGTATAVLATMGLTYAAGVFTTTAAGVWAVTVAFMPIEAPTDQTNQVLLSTSQYGGDPAHKWDDSTFPLAAQLTLIATLYLASGEGFRVNQILAGTVTGTTPISYATITITRVL